jgi:dihydrofolate reductase
MRTLASFILISLDGFYEGPNGEFDWPVVDEEFNDFAIRQLDEADTLGFGRATYEHMAAHWPTEQAQVNDPAITSRMNTKPKLVFSTALEHADWSNTTIIAGEAVDQIETVKAAPGGELLVLGSAHLTAHFAAAGVLDELRIMVCPIAIGQGRSLFEDLKGRLALKLAAREAVRLRQRPAYLPAVALVEPSLASTPLVHDPIEIRGEPFLVDPQSRRSENPDLWRRNKGPAGLLDRT